MNSTFSMVDVGPKPVTRRRAIARGEIQLSPAVCRAVIEKRVPKGDVLVLAEVAGINAAKKTADILPLCHPLTLDTVSVSTEVVEEGSRILVQCSVAAHGRTGVEMEALSGVSAALLCIYDLTKALDKGAVISGIYLEHKEGGKSGSWNHPTRAEAPAESALRLTGIRAGVITVSDRCAAGVAEDRSGPIVRDYLRNQGVALCEEAVVPDDPIQLQGLVRAFVSQRELQLILITGGTGLGPRDLSPEALQSLWTKELPGFGELFRNRGMLSTPHAWLSRATAGLIDKTLVVLLPGSPGGVNEGVALLDQVLPHLLAVIGGGGH